MFARFGYKRTVIDDIVREAGIAKGTFYLYFKSKEDLFQEALITIRRELLEEWRSMLEQESTVRGKIRASLRFSLEALERHPLFARLTIKDEEFRLALSMIDEEVVQQELDQTLHFFRKLFEDGIRNGELRPDIDLDVIPFVLGSLKFMHFHKELAAYGKISDKQFIDALVDLAMRGIIKHEPET